MLQKFDDFKIYEKTILKINDVLTIEPLLINDMPYCILGTDKHDEYCLLLNELQGKYFILDGLYGKFISFAAIDNRTGAFVALKENRDKKDEADLIYVQIIPSQDNGKLGCKIIKLISISKAVKVSVITQDKSNRAVVITDDGSIFEIDLTDARPTLNPLIVGLSRCNDIQKTKDHLGQNLFIVSTEKGVYSFTLSIENIWIIQKINKKAVDTFCIFDKADDQSDQIFLVCQNVINFYQKGSENWYKLLTFEIPEEKTNRIIAWKSEQYNFLATTDSSETENLNIYVFSQKDFKVKQIYNKNNIGVSQFYFRKIEKNSYLVTAGHVASEVTAFSFLQMQATK